MTKAMAKGPFGKDHPENFIDGALTGGKGASNGIRDYKVDRPDQVIKTPVAMDNVKLAMEVETSILDTKLAGSVDNLKHSLSGSAAVNEEVGAAGPVRHVIIPHH